MKFRKAIRRLEARRRAYDEHGPYPKAHNPGKEGPQDVGHIMHRPGSMKK